MGTLLIAAIVIGLCGLGSIIAMLIAEVRYNRLILSDIRRIYDKYEARRIYDQNSTEDKKELASSEV